MLISKYVFLVPGVILILIFLLPGSGVSGEQECTEIISKVPDWENPQISGAHWFQWRDQNVGGRYDSENYDVGFFDVADITNEDLIRAAEECGRNLYNRIK